jgi:hypothetical protein
MEDLMFWKSDPKKKLQKVYEKAMADAMELQRAGKIPEFAKKSAEAEGVLKEIEALETT